MRRLMILGGVAMVLAACSSSGGTSGGGGGSNDAGPVAKRLVQALIDRDLSAYQRDYNPNVAPQRFPQAPVNLSGCQIKDVRVPGQLVVDREDVQVVFQQPCGKWTNAEGTINGIKVGIEILNGRVVVDNWTANF